MTALFFIFTEQKNKSANDVFKKLYDANSKDPQNIYWYGQALLANDDVKGAKTLYQKALQEGVNDAWILVGMGHVEIMEGGDLNAVIAIQAIGSKMADIPTKIMS